jgi:hypothetical protein
MDTSLESRFYKEIQALTPREVDDIVTRDDPQELRYAALSVSMFSTDFDWAQATCVLLAGHSNANVRGNAVLSFGHLARRFGRLDMEVVEPIYRAALDAPDEYVRSQAEDMLEDIRYYLSLGPEWPNR